MSWVERLRNFSKLGNCHTLKANSELDICTVCGAAEGELLYSCPGFRLSMEAVEACWIGNVIDIGDYLYSQAVKEARSK